MTLQWRERDGVAVALSRHGSSHSVWEVKLRRGYGYYATLNIRGCITRDVVESVTFGPYQPMATAQDVAERNESIDLGVIGIDGIGIDCDCDPLADAG